MRWLPILCVLLAPFAAHGEGWGNTGAAQWLDQGNFEDGAEHVDEISVDVDDVTEQIRICTSDNGNTVSTDTVDAPFYEWGRAPGDSRDANEIIVKSPSGVSYDLNVAGAKGFCDAAGDLGMALSGFFVLPGDLPGGVADLEEGTWTVDFAGQDSPNASSNGQATRFWDVTVLDAGDAAVSGSRVHSDRWTLNANGF